MGSIISSRLDYIQKNPEHKMSYSEVEHELDHVKTREHVSSITTVAALVLAILAIMGVMGSGAFLMGAMLAIAAVAASYAYCCRLAETGLRNHLMQRMAGPGSEATQTPTAEATTAESGRLLGFFSRTPDVSGK